jgi:hypothetical protein
MRQRDEWTDVLACRGKRAHTYVMTARNCAEYGTRSVFLSYTVVIRDPTKGGNEGGRGAVGEPGLFFLLRRDALFIDLCRCAGHTMRACLARAAKAVAAGQDGTVPYYVHICAYCLNLGREKPEHDASLFTEWMPVRQVMPGHSFLAPRLR